MQHRSIQGLSGGGGGGGGKRGNLSRAPEFLCILYSYYILRTYVQLRRIILYSSGRVLVFQHDILHSGSKLKKGRKYCLRTDVMFSKDARQAFAAN
jgi:hypothetical protein